MTGPWIYGGSFDFAPGFGDPVVGIDVFKLLTASLLRGLLVVIIDQVEKVFRVAHGVSHPSY